MASAAVGPTRQPSPLRGIYHDVHPVRVNVTALRRFIYSFLRANDPGYQIVYGIGGTVFIIAIRSGVETATATGPRTISQQQSTAIHVQPWRRWNRVSIVRTTFSLGFSLGASCIFVVCWLCISWFEAYILRFQIPSRNELNGRVPREPGHVAVLRRFQTHYGRDNLPLVASGDHTLRCCAVSRLQTLEVESCATRFSDDPLRSGRPDDAIVRSDRIAIFRSRLRVLYCSAGQQTFVVFRDVTAEGCVAVCALLLDY